MFRRFMIVCWALFGLSIAAVAYLWHEADADQEIVNAYSDAIFDHPAMQLELPDPRYESMQDENGHTVAQLLRRQEWAGENRDRARSHGLSLLLHPYSLIT